MGRVPCCERMGLKKGPWKPEEDQILINYIKENGHDNWRALPYRAGLLRCGKSCRLRWMNYLRPDIKRGNFTREEEEAIIKLHADLGNKWSVIAAKLPGRTDNEIKNVWNTHLKKRFRGKSRPEPERKIRKIDSSFGPKLEKYSPAHSSGEISSFTADTAREGGGSDDWDVCLMTDSSLERLTDLDGGYWSEIFSGDVWSGASDFSAISSDFQLQFLNSFASDLTVENCHGLWDHMFL